MTEPQNSIAIGLLIAFGGPVVVILISILIVSLISLGMFIIKKLKQ